MELQYLLHLLPLLVQDDDDLEADQFFTAINTLVLRGGAGGGGVDLPEDEDIQPSDLDTGTMVIVDDLDDEDDDSGTMKRELASVPTIPPPPPPPYI